MNATIEIKDDAGFVLGKVIIQDGKAVFLGDTDKIKAVLNAIPKTKTFPEQGKFKTRLTRMHV